MNNLREENWGPIWTLLDFNNNQLGLLIVVVRPDFVVRVQNGKRFIRDGATQ
jgi:hypothetical protein